MKVNIDEEAYGDLERIYAWIAKDDPTAAGSVIERILAAIDHLGRLPHTGHAGRARDTLEWVVVKLPYVIVYEITAGDDQLIVTGVFHGAQQNRRR
jgi:plasmid stabilization system protein ParE